MAVVMALEKGLVMVVVGGLWGYVRKEVVAHLLTATLDGRWMVNNDGSRARRLYCKLFLLSNLQRCWSNSSIRCWSGCIYHPLVLWRVHTNQFFKIKGK